MPSQWPTGGNVNRASAPSARIAAMANEESSSSASMAPFVAMMADTPHMEDPTANRLVSLGLSSKMRPRKVMKAIDKTSSINTSTRLTEPSFKTSASRKRAPSSTIPVFNQNSYVAMPGLKISATPMVLEISRPAKMAQSTYSMLGKT